jgi:hypothetical protein
MNPARKRYRATLTFDPRDVIRYLVGVDVEETGSTTVSPFPFANL